MDGRRVESQRVSAKGNHLLAALPAADYERIRPSMELVRLSLGAVLYEPGSPPRHVYFPLSCVVSLLRSTLDGHTVEVAAVGNEGCASVGSLLGWHDPARAVVQVPGIACRVSAAILVESFRAGGGAQALLLRYLQAVMTQITQIAVCNRLHTVEQQLCRWLLLHTDRIGADRLRTTQELISQLLGVRRSSVTHALSRLQQAGLISCFRGGISILDRPRLEAHACECYAVVRQEELSLLSRKLE